ncbi:Rap1a/Tai family immunity protein [Stenotrophomonas sp. LARHCG68]
MEGGLASWVQDPAQRTMLSTSMAISYIVGVADSSRNRLWCPKELPDMGSLSGGVLDYLADLPRKRYAENAAVVVAEALSKDYPCR